MVLIRNDAHRDEFHRDQQWHKPVRVATTANITIATALNAGDSLDGVTLAAGDRVLVKDQSTGSQNGIYIAGATPARAYDMLAGIQAMGAFVFVIAGATNGQTLWHNTNTTLPTIDATSLTWEEFSGTPGGGGETPFDHGAMGAAETFNVTDGNWHRGTLDDNVTITVSGFTVDVGIVMLAELTQDGGGGNAITWDSDVDFGGNDDQPDQAAGSVTFFLLWTSQGDSAIYGAKVGGGGGSALEVLDEGVSLDTAVTSLNFVGGGVEATNVAHAVTVTVEGVTETLVQEVGHYELLMTGSSPPEPIEDGTGTDWLYVWVYP